MHLVGEGGAGRRGWINKPAWSVVQTQKPFFVRRSLATWACGAGWQGYQATRRTKFLATACFELHATIAVLDDARKCFKVPARQSRASKHNIPRSQQSVSYSAKMLTRCYIPPKSNPICDVERSDLGCCKGNFAAGRFPLWLSL